MSHDDVLFGFRLRRFSLAGEIGVRPACRAMGIHHSTYYRWKRRVERWGLEALRVRERRRPRMPNELGPHPPPLTGGGVEKGPLIEKNAFQVIRRLLDHHLTCPPASGNAQWFPRSGDTWRR